MHTHLQYPNQCLLGSSIVWLPCATVARARCLALVDILGMVTAVVVAVVVVASTRYPTQLPLPQCSAHWDPDPHSSCCTIIFPNLIYIYHSCLLLRRRHRAQSAKTQSRKTILSCIAIFCQQQRYVVVLCASLRSLPYLLNVLTCCYCTTCAAWPT